MSNEKPFLNLRPCFSGSQESCSRSLLNSSHVLLSQKKKCRFMFSELPSSLINQIPLTKADLNDKSPNSVHNSIIIKLIRCDMRYIDTIFFVLLLLFVLSRPISFKLLKNFCFFLLYLNEFLSKAQKKEKPHENNLLLYFIEFLTQLETFHESKQTSLLM